MPWFISDISFMRRASSIINLLEQVCVQECNILKLLKTRFIMLGMMWQDELRLSWRVWNLGRFEHKGKRETVACCLPREVRETVTWKGHYTRNLDNQTTRLDSVKLSQEYLVQLNWIKLASNPCRLDSSTGRTADLYPEGANSNPARVNIFQLTSAV